MGTKQKVLTARAVATLKPGEWASDPDAWGAGRLQARGLAGGGVAYYYRYTGPDGNRVRLPIAAASLAQAKAKADEYSLRYRNGDRDLRRSIDLQDRERKAEADAKERAHQAAQAKQAGTLGVLLTAYADHLSKLGKASAGAVRLMLTRNVEKPHPALWVKPAADVTPEDGVAILSTLVEAEKRREAGKLRAAMRAAFSLAIRSHADPAAAASLRKLALRANPFADLAAIASGSNARDRALSVTELKAYWRRLAKLDEPARSLLRFHLLTGGQRVEQLARAQVSQWDRDSGVITLLDTKGRRTQPRRHPVPILPDAADAIAGMAPERLGPFLFTITAGQTGCSYASANARLREVSDAMVKAGEATAPFTLGDIRRTVETRLAALGVRLDVRARLQSHGLSGVQARHYDRHDYLPETRAALEQLRALLEAKPAKVTPIRKAGGRG